MLRVLLVFGSLISVPAFAQESSITAGVKADCAAQWPSDFSMQEFCIVRQGKAFLAMHDVYQSERTQVQDEIIDQCLSQWETANGQDWAMVEFCYNRQISAYQRLNQ